MERARPAGHSGTGTAAAGGTCRSADAHCRYCAVCLLPQQASTGTGLTSYGQLEPAPTRAVGATWRDRRRRELACADLRPSATDWPASAADPGEVFTGQRFWSRQWARGRRGNAG